MPSAFTHALVGAAVGSGTRAPRVSRLRCAGLLALLAAAPDLDVVGLRLGIAYGHPLGHRGLTHSLLFAAGVAPAAAWLCAPDLLRRGGAAPFVRLAALCFLAIASHGLLDMLTDAGLGVGLLVPLSAERFFFPWRPLLTSPLSVSGFFGPRGLRILANEMLWVWIPVTLAWAAGIAIRRRRRKESRR